MIAQATALAAAMAASSAAACESIELFGLRVVVRTWATGLADIIKRDPPEG